MDIELSSTHVEKSKLAGFSLTAGSQLKKRLLRVLSRLLFQEIEDDETGT